MERVQFKLVLPLFFVAFLLVPSIRAMEIKYCDKKGNYAVKVNGVEMSPDPVVRGKPATFSLAATTGQTINGGKLVIEVSYFGVHIHTENHDLCAETSCPVAIGDFVLAHTQTLPAFTPPGSYTLKMKMTDKSGHQLTCIAFDFNIGVGAVVADS
ncbi:PREDICTED: putative phosphatidylglycerol/phosphatidylinositol transfer protein DDB_G0282179 [Nelumbo nucifera]|uniref:Phosphatidylglycerol/phosphatidylinositol transfer protein DDB_G0282179 n=1 Tax=Nelumbo nucifera TaxID=4432 RepID=A0A1U7Z9P8_NELNU|nr:PREDICTED: putative phosphatidylglycerol/phosphatidylinositol transfer protein DDB_G0282179 [Nelumbo nucifera]